MKAEMRNKYFFVDSKKEVEDILRLVNIIRKDGWVEKEMVIVNCSPDYSSLVSQMINHRLSHLNDNELYEVIPMEMPFPTFNQIWNPIKKEPQGFDSYLKEWVALNIRQNQYYLFVDSGVLRGKNFNKVQLSIKPFIEPSNYRFASPYLEKNSIFKPDYFVEVFDQQERGGLLYSWENADNPNWNY